MKYTDKVPGLHAKARALTDSFFAEENARVMQEFKRAVAVEEKKIEFREYLNIDNEEVLDALVELAVEPEALVAFSLVPLVEVAWADGEIQPKERDAILKAAIDSGVEDNSPTYTLLKNWLQMQPSPLLFETWRGYIQELLPSLGERSREPSEDVGPGTRTGHCGGRRRVPWHRVDLGKRKGDARQAGAGFRVMPCWCEKLRVLIAAAAVAAFVAMPAMAADLDH